MDLETAVNAVPKIKVLTNKKLPFPTPEKELRSSQEQVDYFRYQFDSLDLHTTWRKAIQHKKTFPFQGARRENIIWRRYNIFYSKLAKKLRSERLGAYTVTEDVFGCELLGPFFSSEQHCEDCKGGLASDVSSLHTRVDTCESDYPLKITTTPLKPVLKKRFCIRDYIAKIKTNYSDSGRPSEDSPRRNYSDTALCDQKKSPHAFPGRKGLNNGSYASPVTPKDLVIQFFADSDGPLSASTNPEKRIRFNSIVYEKVYEPTSSVTAPGLAFGDINFGLSDAEFQRKQAEMYLKVNAAIAERKRLADIDALKEKEIEIEIEKEAEERRKEARNSIDVQVLSKDTLVSEPFSLGRYFFYPGFKKIPKNSSIKEIELDVAPPAEESQELPVEEIRKYSDSAIFRNVLKRGDRRSDFLSLMHKDNTYKNDHDFLDYPDDEIETPAAYIPVPELGEASSVTIGGIAEVAAVFANALSGWW